MTKTQKNHKIAKTICITVGIAAIAAMEIAALAKGLDGQYFSIAIGAVTFLVGYLFGKK